MSTGTLERPAREPTSDHRARSALSRPPGWVLPALVVVGTILRLWRLGASGLSFDESFTAMAARRPLGDLLEFLRMHDSHPPLDYLIRAPLARAGASAFALRLPSFVFSVAALTLFAWWMRRRGWAGVVATGLMATSIFQLSYGREARMYALMGLIGVAAAMVAEGWLVRPRRGHAWAICGIVVVGTFDHVSMFLLGGGLLLVAGFRTDRDAWRWRVGLALGLLPWMAVWAGSALQQANGHHADWISRTTVRGFVDVVASLVTNSQPVKAIVFAAILAGGILIWREGGALRRVWWCCAAAPAAVAGTIGVAMPFLLARTLSIAAWAPLVAIGVLVDAGLRRWRVLGVAALAAAAVFVVPPGWQYVNSRWETDVVEQHLRAVGRPGDVIAIQPAWLAPLVDWSMGAARPGSERSVSIAGLRGSHALALGGPPTGRIWFVQPVGLEVPVTGFTRCGKTWSTGSTDVFCLRR